MSNEEVAIARKRKGLTQQQVADELKQLDPSVTPQMVSNWELGRTKVPHTLRSTLEQIVSGASDLSAPMLPKAGGESIPYYGQVPAGEWEEPQQDTEWVSVPARFSNPKKFFCLKISGSSMAPIYQPGDMVIVRRTSEPHVGQPVIVRNGHKELSIKRLLSTERGLMLKADNPTYGEMAKTSSIEMIGQVVYLMRDVL